MVNIVFIIADQFRFDALGSAGKFPVKTPNLDRLASEGTVFGNAYCANPVCVPSRASLMTGLYSYDHGVYYNDQNWPDRLDTLPRQLSDNCYYTCHVGKKHIHPPNKSIGFDKLILSSGGPAFKARKQKKEKQAQGKWTEVETLNRGYPVEPAKTPIEEYGPVAWTDKALAELDLIRQRRQCGGDCWEPFFLKVSFSKPHSPCNPPEPYFSMYSPDAMPPPAATEEERGHFSSQLKWFCGVWDQMDEERKLKHRAQYMGCVTLVDEQVGRIVQKVQDLGLYENTLFVFTADHGDHLGDHHLQQKAFFYDASARVPFIFAGPGVPKGKTVRENVSLIDLYPTIMEYCGLSMPARRDPSGELIYPDTDETDAMSLVPYFCGDDPAAPDRVVISENACFGQRFMLKKGDTKVNCYLTEGEIERFDRYDLSEDPDELRNRGDGMTPDDLDPDMRRAFDMVMEKSARHRSRHYYFQNKIRPMFT